MMREEKLTCMTGVTYECFTHTQKKPQPELGSVRSLYIRFHQNKSLNSSSAYEQTEIHA